ncbi:MAG TPA: ABC transporter ATP-binding protein [Anaeromyxobacteraceae bacterium]|nr:ABC transporter ATP-binding protein [Anaeromyxobacteraceae bacterium]
MIRFEAMSKSFGAQRAVESLTLAVRAGEVVALLGPNGSGKTTSLKAAAGLLRPSSGRVLVGEPGLPAWQAGARRVLSFLPQKVSFPDSLTGREVVEFYRRLRRVAPERTEDVLRISALNGAAGRQVGTYSGGMTQRLGLAVAVLPEAPVLLLDEPTSSLDADGLCAFYGLVERRRQQGQTVLFTSHQWGDVERLADRVAVLVEGRLVADVSQRDLSERLAERGAMRIRLEACPSELLARVQAAAPGTRWSLSQLWVPGPASCRAAALEAVRAAGLEIRGLVSEDGRLDELYRDLARAGGAP